MGASVVAGCDWRNRPGLACQVGMLVCGRTCRGGYLHSVALIAPLLQAREYIQHMLERPPPQWQAHRGGGDWGDKGFSLDGGSAGEGGQQQRQKEERPRQRLQTTQCHYWDGSCCWGERLLWPGKPCR